MPATHHDCLPSTFHATIFAVYIGGIDIYIKDPASISTCGLDTSQTHGALLPNFLHTRNPIICGDMVPPTEIRRPKIHCGIIDCPRYGVS